MIEPTRPQLDAAARTLGLLVAAKLRLAGLITVRREGRRHIYTVDDPHIVTLVEQIVDHIAPDGSLASDPVLTG